LTHWWVWKDGQTNMRTNAIFTDQFPDFRVFRKVSKRQRIHRFTM